MLEGSRAGRDGWRAEVVFLLATCAFSWTLWGLVIAGQRGWIGVRLPVGPLGSFGPAFGALVAIGLSQGREGLRGLGRRIKAWRAPGAAWAFALLITPALQAAALAGFLAMGNRLTFEHLERLVWAVPLFLGILVLGGPLGEEIGWRGFLLPRLLERHSPVVASLLVALPWFAWHVPAFWMNGAQQQGTSLLLFALAVAGCSFLFTWLHLRSRGSVLLAIVLHASFDTCSFGLPMLDAALDTGSAYDYLFLIALVVMAGALALTPSLRRAAGARQELAAA